MTESVKDKLIENLVNQVELLEEKNKALEKEIKEYSNDYTTLHFENQRLKNQLEQLIKKHNLQDDGRL